MCFISFCQRPDYFQRLCNEQVVEAKNRHRSGPSSGSVLFSRGTSCHTLWAPRPKREVVYPVVLELRLRRLTRVRQGFARDSFFCFEHFGGRSFDFSVFVVWSSVVSSPKQIVLFAFLCLLGQHILARLEATIR